MKALILFLSLAVSLNAAPFHRKPVVAKSAPTPVAEVEPAPGPLPEPPEVPPYTLNPDGSETLSKEHAAEVKALAIGIKTELENVSKEAEKAKKSEAEVRAFHATALNLATDLQKSVNVLTEDRNNQAKAKDAALTKADYWHTKHSEAVAKLWWWRVRGWFFIIVSLVLTVGVLLLKFTTWGAKTLGPLVAKVAA